MSTHPFLRASKFFQRYNKYLLASHLLMFPYNTVLPFVLPFLLPLPLDLPLHQNLCTHNIHFMVLLQPQELLHCQLYFLSLRFFPPPSNLMLVTFESFLMQATLITTPTEAPARKPIMSAISGYASGPMISPNGVMTGTGREIPH